MQRQEVNAVLDDDFLEFLRQNGLFDEFKEGFIHCYYCDTSMTIENVFAILYLDGIKFCCNGSHCMNLFSKRT